MLHISGLQSVLPRLLVCVFDMDKSYIRPSSKHILYHIGIATFIDIKRKLGMALQLFLIKTNHSRRHKGISSTGDPKNQGSLLPVANPTTANKVPLIDDLPRGDHKALSLRRGGNSLGAALED